MRWNRASVLFEAQKVGKNVRFIANFFDAVGFGEKIKWTSLNDSLQAARKRYNGE